MHELPQNALGFTRETSRVVPDKAHRARQHLFLDMKNRTILQRKSKNV